MKKILLRIISFVIIWNIIIDVFNMINVSGLFTIPCLLIGFAISLVLVEKTVDYFLDDHKD